VIIGTVQPGYAMAFGKYNNGGGPASQSIIHGSSGKGNANENGSYGASLDAEPYQVPGPEPAAVVLLASGLFDLGV